MLGLAKASTVADLEKKLRDVVASAESSVAALSHMNRDLQHQFHLSDSERLRWKALFEENAQRSQSEVERLVNQHKLVITLMQDQVATALRESKLDRERLASSEAAFAKAHNALAEARSQAASDRAECVDLRTREAAAQAARDSAAANAEALEENFRRAHLESNEREQKTAVAHKAEVERLQAQIDGLRAQ